MKIYQIYYNEITKQEILPKFIPYDNTLPNKPNEFEYGVMRNLYTKHDFKESLGIFSWKFNQKTNLTDDQVYEFIEANPGYDIYTFNPFVNMNNFKNVWLQGEFYHRGMLKFVTDIFQKSKVDMALINPQNFHSPKITCYCNYWVANKKFWDIFMSYTEQIYKYCYKADQKTQDLLFNIKADRVIDSAMFSFIFERLFTTILYKHQKQFKVLPFYQ